MIVDCFPFFEEFDLLEIRLNVLKDVVDEFVVVEGNYTHSGKHKGFIFEKEQARFSEFPIVYLGLDLEPVVNQIGTDSWVVENYHRRCLQDALYNEYTPSDEDVFIISDLDEIPDPSYIDGRSARFHPKMYYFYLNCSAGYRWHRGPYMLSGKDYLATDDLHALRLNDNRSNTLVHEAGWHFSSVGTTEDIISKLGSFAHIEYDNDESKDRTIKYRNELKDIHGDKLSPVPIDESFPSYLYENQDKYKHLIYAL